MLPLMVGWKDFIDPQGGIWDNFSATHLMCGLSNDPVLSVLADARTFHKTVTH